MVQPYRNFCFYKKILINSYKTLVHPYSVLGIGMIRMIKEDSIKYGDGQFMLNHQYPSYQVSLAKIMGDIYLEFIDPQLIKEFYERQKEGCYIKNSKGPIVQLVKQMVGSGLMFS
jgi:hypothetical protein